MPPKLRNHIISFLLIQSEKRLTVRSHLATTPQTFYVINTTFEMGCLVTNVTVHTWQQKNDKKTHRCRQVRTDPDLSMTSRWINAINTFLPPAFAKILCFHRYPPVRYTPPWGRYNPQAVQPPLGQVHPRAVTPPPQCMLGNGQQAGGTHPTGMHSCFDGQWKEDGTGLSESVYG